MAEAASHPGAPTPSGASVLVVDDEGGLRDLLRWELSSEGYSVTTAANGAEAIDAIHLRSFDLVISDVWMPGLTGLDVLRAVREEAPETEVIVSTGTANLETALECLRGGAADLLPKPVLRDDLLTAVNRALQRRKVRSAAGLRCACEAIFAAPADASLPAVVADVARAVMGADQASLLISGPRGSLVAAHSTGGGQAPATPLADAIATEAIRGRRPLLGTGASGDAGGSSILHPLVAGESAVGLLVLRRGSGRQPFRQEDLDRSSVLASQILLALENGRLVQRLAESERLAAIGQLAAGVAHEINNPISYVLAAQTSMKQGLRELGEVGALLDGGAGGDALQAAWARIDGKELLVELREAADAGAEGSGRIRDIAGDLRSLARSDEGGASRTVLDLDEAVASALRIAKPALGRARVVQRLGGPAQVRGSPGKLSQVFLNLIVNAAQAGASQVVITTARAGSSVIASVADDGPGILAEHAGQLFEPFFTTKPPGVGTGLGLWLSREIVRGFGGDLVVTTAAGAGTTFTITLPAAEG